MAESGEHSAPLSVWVAVSLIIAGSIVSGIALIEWIWPVFWVGDGLMPACSSLGYFFNIMDQVSEYSFATTPMPEIDRS